jgi:glycosyltransferase involved in cell wall biosynthesis
MLNKLSHYPIALIATVTLILGILLELALWITNFASTLIWSKTFNLYSITLFTRVIVCVGFSLLILDIIKIAPKRRKNREIENRPVENRKLTAVLTAYNDEESIGDAVLDFLSHPLVTRVIVVDNNSIDKTGEKAATAGAIVIQEKKQGYGACVYRSMAEAAKYKDTDFFVLCEGDLTFRASDIDKLIAYAPHADVINGTRIVEQLRDKDTQLTTFMFFGNFAVGKLLELKHLGKGTITDVGTTFKICKSEVIRKNINLYNSSINHEFNAHFLDVTIANDIRVVEVPITFRKRVGISKGGNSSNFRALVVGMRMIYGILFGWKSLEENYAQ